MELETVKEPFKLEPVQEVPLRNSPLRKVIFQVRFPRAVALLESALHDGALAKSIADSFPYVEKTESRNLVVDPAQGATTESVIPTWVMTSRDFAKQVTCTGDSIALVDDAYTSRADFLALVRKVLHAVQSEVNPPDVARIGVRYVNRVTEMSLHTWMTSITETARGISLAIPEEERQGLQLGLTQVQFRYPADGNSVAARWGLLPEGAGVDPALPGIPEPSWVLDVDVFHDTDLVPFSADDILELAESFTERAYRVFRWVIPPAALAAFDPGEVPE